MKTVASADEFKKLKTMRNKAIDLSLSIKDRALNPGVSLKKVREVIMKILEDDDAVPASQGL